MKVEKNASFSISSRLNWIISAAALIMGGFLGSELAHANDRSAALVSDFRFFCMRGTPTYESLDAYAIKLKLPIKKDLSRDMGHGDRLRSRSWTVGDTTGPYELVAAEAIHGDVMVETCGIGSADANGEDIHTDLTVRPHLGSSTDSVSSDGRVKTATWTLPSGESIVLTHAISGPGVYLTYVDKSIRSK
jgi:hypothetical protein